MLVLPSLGQGNLTVEAAQVEVFQKVLAENYIRSLGRSFSGFAQAARDCALFLFPGRDAGRTPSTAGLGRGRRNRGENQLEDCIKNQKNIVQIAH